MRKTSQTKPTDDKDPSQAIELKNSVRPRLHPLDPLEGRVALVTGGARRICRAISAERTHCTETVLDGRRGVTQARVRGRSVSAKPIALAGAAAAEP